MKIPHKPIHADATEGERAAGRAGGRAGGGATCHAGGGDVHHYTN